MDISEKQAKVLKALEGTSPRFGMKASRIATELYGHTGRRKRFRDGHKVTRAVRKLNEKDLIEDVNDNAPCSPARWSLTDRGKKLLEETKD